VVGNQPGEQQMTARGESAIAAPGTSGISTFGVRVVSGEQVGEESMYSSAYLFTVDELSRKRELCRESRDGWRSARCKTDAEPRSRTGEQRRAVDISVPKEA
jgi:hypothetical protein